MLWQIIQLVKSWCIASFQHGSVSHWMFHCSLVCIVTVSQISHCAAFPISLAEWCRLSLVCKFLHDLNRYLLDLENQHFNLVYVFGLGIFRLGRYFSPNKPGMESSQSSMNSAPRWKLWDIYLESLIDVKLLFKRKGLMSSCCCWSERGFVLHMHLSSACILVH